MATNEAHIDGKMTDDKMENKDYKVKVICLGDSAVGKSKWVCCLVLLHNFNEDLTCC